MASLSVVTQGFLGASWHDPVTRTHVRETKVTLAVRLPSSIEVISHLRLTAPAIYSPRGRQLSSSESYWLFMSDKHSSHVAGILSRNRPTSTASAPCFAPLFARWHRICFFLPRYIFITAEHCWYRAPWRTKTHKTMRGVWKIWPHTRCRQGSLSEVNALLSLRGEVPGGPRGHWVTPPGDVSSAGQSAQDGHQRR